MSFNLDALRTRLRRGRSKQRRMMAVYGGLNVGDSVSKSRYAYHSGRHDALKSAEAMIDRLDKKGGGDAKG